MATQQGQQGQQGPSMEMLAKMGPPYPPQGAGLGGLPTTSVDVPISAVFIVLFVTSAVTNMTILQLNNRRGHKFILSGVLFGFSMARIVANIMRIVWATRPHNVRIAIAANVFTNAGVLLLFAINLILTQRVLRAFHPSLGWSSPARLLFRFLYVGVGACLAMVIVAVVYSFYTLDVHVRSQLRDVQLVATVYLALLAFLPLPINLLAVLLPRTEPIDKFGTGRLRTKVLLLLFTSTLLALGACFRTAVAFIQRPANNPGWYHHKACYYCFNFVIELIVVATYVLSRFDRRFHIPNGSSGPGDYSRRGDATKSSATGVLADDDTLGDSDRPRTVAEQRKQEQDWESRAQHELEKRESV